MVSTEINNILKRLDEHETRIKDLEEQIKVSENEIELTEKTDMDSKFPQNLCKSAGINSIELSHILDYDDDILELICYIKDLSNPEKQFNGTLVILTVYHFWKNINKLKSSELGKMLKNCDVDLKNYARTLNKSEHKKYIRRIGQKGSHDFSYQVRDPLGIEKGLELIKELAIQESSGE